MDVMIYDPTGTIQIMEMTYTDDPEKTDIQDLWYESVIAGGPSVAGFTVKRDITVSHKDLQKFNIVKVVAGPDLRWSGWMDYPKRRIKPRQFEIQCIGESSQMEDLGYFEDLGTMKGSAFINNVMLADERVRLGAGYIWPDDYTAAALAVRPFRRYREILDEYMKVNEKVFWEVRDGLIYWQKYDLGSAKYRVSLADCSTGDIGQSGPGNANWVHYSWSNDGTNVEMGDVYDQATIDAWGGRIVMRYLAVPGVVTDAYALNQAQTLLNELKIIRMQAGFTVSKVYDRWDNEIEDLGEIKAGDNIQVLDIYPTDTTISIASEVNELTTFMIKSIRFNRRSQSVAVTLSEFQSRVDVAMARLEAIAA